ncbi:MAG: hypothetical protein M3Z24_03690 [Chloroflexota bacterium]|nr:hypothetical protein [Chloroflexota bacterium]
MVCPRCHGLWNQQKNGCTRCGFVLRTASPLPRGARPLHPFSPMSGGAQSAPRPHPDTVPRPERAKSPRQTRTLSWDTQTPQTSAFVQRSSPPLPLTKEKLPAQPVTAENAPVQPGTLLFNGRYHLHERQRVQIWQAGAFEAVWQAQDTQLGGEMVTICEVFLPGSDTILKQATFQSARRTLRAISRHSHITMLWDMFNEYGHAFFVYKQPEGQAVIASMQHEARLMSEHNVVECCIQMTDVLEFLLQQSPPLVHGLICPENILIGHTNSHYSLANFSILLAGGATQFVTGTERSKLSPYVAPEFARGLVDIRSDIYSLLASAYYLVTGKAPKRQNGSILSARSLNPAITPQFEAILTKGLATGKGLRPDMSQRYQHPAELRQDLLMLYTTLALRAARTDDTRIEDIQLPEPGKEEPPKTSADKNLALHEHPMLQTLAPDVEEEESLFLLPQPEELPPFVERNDARKALACFLSLMTCLMLVIMLGRGWI